MEIFQPAIAMWSFTSTINCLGLDSLLKPICQLLLLMAEIRLNTWDIWNPTNNGINYQPELVNAGFQGPINSMFIVITPTQRVLTPSFATSGWQGTIPSYQEVDVGEFLEQRDESIVFLCGCWPRNRGGKTPENGWWKFHGKPYEQMDDFGGFPIIFGSTPMYF